jgi:DNA-binding beta-propeller fold protein YncE
MYVADGTGHTITVLNPDGTVARTWGREGTGDGQFKEPWGVAVSPDGSVFVSDTWNHRVQKFDAEGRFLMKWGGTEIGTETGRFYGPRGIAVSPGGDVLVADTGNKRIQVFSQDGVFRKTVGTEGTRPGQFREPVGVAVDRQGRIYVADTWNQRIQVFDANFEPLAQHAVRGWDRQDITNKPFVTVTADGDIYATVPESQAVVRVKDGQVNRIALPPNPRVALPTGIGVDPQGRLLVVDPGSKVVVAYEIGDSAEMSAPGR